MTSLYRAVRLGAILFLIGAGLSFGAVLDPGQSAAATEETMYMEVGGGHYCADCCSPDNILCCQGTVCDPGET